MSATHVRCVCVYLCRGVGKLACFKSAPLHSPVLFNTHIHTYICMKHNHAHKLSQAVRDGYALALCDLSVAVNHEVLEDVIKTEKKAAKKAALTKLRTQARGEVLQRTLVQVCVACLCVMCVCFC